MAGGESERGSRQQTTGVDISVVVPVYNERDALPALVAELDATLDGLARSSEVIFVDDGSTDGSASYLADLEDRSSRVRALGFRRNFGKSAALMAGFQEAVGSIVVTLDSDGQDDPAEIPTLLAELDEGFDLVSGWKAERQDSVRRRWASRIFNSVTGRLSGVELHDMNCGFKAYRSECVHSLTIYGELHRYIPVLAAQQGWRMSEVPVNHRSRQHGASKFGLERYARGAFDLVAVLFMGRYQHRPLHLFGGLGLVVMLAGLAIGLYLTVEKLAGASIGNRPLLLLGVLLLVVGAQFLTFGLLAQMLAAVGREKNPSPPVALSRVAARLAEKDE